MKIETKSCRVCGKEKLNEEFEVDKRIKSGDQRTNRCYACKYEATLKYRATRTGKISRKLENAKQRAKRFGVVDDLTITEVKEVVGYFEDACVYCGEELEDDIVLEHVRSFSEDGPNSKGNIVISCDPCNRKKNNLPLIDFHYRNNESFTKERFFALVDYLAEINCTDRWNVVDDLTAHKTDFTLRKVRTALDKYYKEGVANGLRG
ncbi:HNH endonuclease [Halalkalibacter flavus]|uniref:HNH endonuclease n=1 Tax=Halalkalibacter flavus TaxID=3090668 RepID=UPI002FC935E5